MQKTLESLAPSGIVGDDFFLDHCHFNVYGHKVTAAAIMQSLCESKFLDCPASYSGWKEIFTQISEGTLDEKNLSNEYLMTAFYLINGTQWEKTPQYEKALFYLEKAYELNSRNEKIYPLLAETYQHLGRGQDADEFLKKIKTA